MKPITATAGILSLAMLIAALPLATHAETVTGPNGGAASGSAKVVPNRGGGYTGTGQGSATGARGGNASGQGSVKTNGQQSATYSGTASGTTAKGKTVAASTSGSASYNQSSGYSGQNSTTVNGKTVSTQTANQLTTISTPQGTRTLGTRR